MFEEQDVYDDLDNYDTIAELRQLREENKNLREANKGLNETIERITEVQQNLSATYKTLETNYSVLLVTARAEIERKTKMITALNAEKDKLIFRQLGNGKAFSQLRYQKRSPENDEEILRNLPRGTKRKLEDTQNVQNKIPRKEPVADTRDNFRKKTLNEYRQLDNVIENNPRTKDDVKQMLPERVVKPAQSSDKVRPAQIAMKRRMSMPASRICSPPYISDEELLDSNIPSEICKYSSNRMDNRPTEKDYGKLRQSKNVVKPHSEIEIRKATSNHTNERPIELDNDKFVESELVLRSRSEIGTCKVSSNSRNEWPAEKVNEKFRQSEVIVKPYSENVKGASLERENINLRLERLSQNNRQGRKSSQESDEINRNISYNDRRRWRSPSPRERQDKPLINDYTSGRSRYEKEKMRRYRNFWSPALEDSPDRESRGKAPERDHRREVQKNRAKSRDCRKLVSPSHSRDRRQGSNDRRRAELDLVHKNEDRFETKNQNRYKDKVDPRTYSRYETRTKERFGPKTEEVVELRNYEKCDNTKERFQKRRPNSMSKEQRDGQLEKHESEVDKEVQSESRPISREEFQKKQITEFQGSYKEKIKEVTKSKEVEESELQGEQKKYNIIEDIQEVSATSEKVNPQLINVLEVRNCQSPDEGEFVDVLHPKVNKVTEKEQLTIKDDPRLYSVRYFTTNEIEINKHKDVDKCHLYKNCIRDKFRDIDLKVCQFGENFVSEPNKISNESVADIYMDIDTQVSNESLESGEILEHHELYNMALVSRKSEQPVETVLQSNTILMDTCPQDISNNKLNNIPPIKDNVETKASNENMPTTQLLRYKISKKTQREEVLGIPSTEEHCTSEKLKTSCVIESHPNHRVRSKSLNERILLPPKHYDDLVPESRNRSPTPIPEGSSDCTDGSWDVPHKTDELSKEVLANTKYSDVYSSYCCSDNVADALLYKELTQNNVANDISHKTIEKNEKCNTKVQIKTNQEIKGHLPTSIEPDNKSTKQDKFKGKLELPNKTCNDKDCEILERYQKNKNTFEANKTPERQSKSRRKSISVNLKNNILKSHMTPTGSGNLVEEITSTSSNCTGGSWDEPQKTDEWSKDVLANTKYSDVYSSDCCSDNVADALLYKELTRNNVANDISHKTIEKNKKCNTKVQIKMDQEKKGHHPTSIEPDNKTSKQDKTNNKLEIPNKSCNDKEQKYFEKYKVNQNNFEANKTPERQGKSHRKIISVDIKNNILESHTTPTGSDNMVEEIITTTPKSSRKSKRESKKTLKALDNEKSRKVSDRKITQNAKSVKISNKTKVSLKNNEVTSQPDSEKSQVKSKTVKEKIKKSKKEIDLFGDNSLIMPEDLDEAFKDADAVKTDNAELLNINEFNDISMNQKTEDLINKPDERNTKQCKKTLVDTNKKAEKINAKENQKNLTEKSRLSRKITEVQYFTKYNEQSIESTTKNYNDLKATTIKDTKSQVTVTEVINNSITCEVVQSDCELNKDKACNVQSDINKHNKGIDELSKFTETVNMHASLQDAQTEKKITEANRVQDKVGHESDSSSSVTIHMPLIGDMAGYGGSTTAKSVDKKSKNDFENNTKENVAQALLEMHNQKHSLHLTPNHNPTEYNGMNMSDNGLITSTPNPKVFTTINPPKELCIQSPIKEIVEKCETSKTMEKSNNEVENTASTLSQNSETNPAPPKKFFFKRRRIVVKN